MIAAGTTDGDVIGSEETFELARIAEEEGFETATIGHHHFMPGNQRMNQIGGVFGLVRIASLRLGRFCQRGCRATMEIVSAVAIPLRTN